eukprot:CAMPEP_0173088930 /NCGR_PEP_ID=MMETSP1102-20130122/25427_1 /TAXON_ID=49646 /ORGANISM="Geminigera sp., Strain Caron Lab Isolate" /LENGTH=111 /DNA_ID=CAMNT_0013972327 /DNA_START=343 /DNA_END=675 /DNA_ORIENTATION=-
MAAQEQLTQRIDSEVLRWKSVAQDELSVRMQLSKDRRAVQLDLQQTQASILKSQRRRSEQVAELTHLRGKQESYGHNLVRAQAALAILQARLTGEPATLDSSRSKLGSERG